MSGTIGNIGMSAVMKSVKETLLVQIWEGQGRLPEVRVFREVSGEFFRQWWEHVFWGVIKKLFQEGDFKKARRPKCMGVQ